MTLLPLPPLPLACQVDNNLAGSNTPVLAYPTPPPSGDIESSYPILKVVAEKVPHKSPFAQVFKVSVYTLITYRLIRTWFSGDPIYILLKVEKGTQIEIN